MTTFKRAVGLNAVGSIASPVAVLVTSPILAQTLGVEGRGAVAAATAPLMLLTNALTLGLPEAATYYVARRRGLGAGRVIQIASIGVAVGLLGTLLISLVSPFLAGGDSGLAVTLSICGFACAPSLVVGIVRGIYAGEQKWGRIAIEKVVGAGARVVALVFLSVIGSLTVVTGAIAIALSAFVGGLVYFGPRLGSTSVPTSTKEVVGYGARIWLGSLTGILLSRLDQSLVLPLSTAYELGLYVVAVNLAELALVLNASVSAALFSVEARSPNLERIGRVGRISTAVTLVSCAIIAAIAWPVLPVLFGAGFRSSYFPTLILLLSIIVGNPASIIGSALSARGWPMIRSLSLALSLIVNVAALVLLVPTMGATGAAVATTAGNLAAAMLALHFGRRRLGRSVASMVILQKADVRWLASSLKRRTL